MEKIPITKTILAVIPQIDKQCEVIEKTNHARAVFSFNSLWNTEDLMERIINQAYRCQHLHNLKIKVVKLLDKMPRKLGEVLELHFIQGKTPTQIAHLAGKTERTVFRQINQATELFANKLEEIGITAITFRQLLQQNSWIRAEYERQFE